MVYVVIVAGILTLVLSPYGTRFGKRSFSGDGRRNRRGVYTHVRHIAVNVYSVHSYSHNYRNCITTRNEPHYIIYIYIRMYVSVVLHTLAVSRVRARDTEAINMA